MKTISPVRLFAAFVLMASLTLVTFADTVRLKDGSIIKGRITSYTGGRFTIEIGDGQRKRELSFDAAEVESIEFETIARPMIGSNQARSNERTAVVTNNTTLPASIPRPETLPDNVGNNRSSPTVVGSTPVSGAAKPVEVSVKVLADNTSNGWTNSGWVVKKGQRIRITASGEISLGKSVRSGAGGLWDVDDETKLLKAVPTGALLAVIGDDNNEFIYIGEDREFVASRDGALFLGVNEGNLNDNSGVFDVKIAIYP